MDFTDTFHKLTADEQEALMANGEYQSHDNNAIILEQAQDNRGIYIVINGEVRVERRLRVKARYVGEDSKDRGPVEKLIRVEIARLGPGALFGEMSFVDGATTSARVVASGPVETKYIDGVTIDRFMAADPGFAGRFYHSLASVLVKRLRMTNKRLSAKVGKAATGG